MQLRVVVGADWTLHPWSQVGHNSSTNNNIFSILNYMLAAMFNDILNFRVNVT